MLDISGCLSPVNPAFDAAIEFLASNRTVTNLHVCGTRKTVLSGSALMSVIGILRPNAVLTILDLRSNVIEDGQLPEFADVLVANTTLKKLAFSLTGIADPEAVTAFWRRLSQRPQGLLVQLKYTELRGQKDRSISDTQIANWKKLQDAVARGGSGRAAPSVVSEFGDWAILQPPVPQFDNASVLEQKRARFDVSVLWADLNMVDPE